MPLYEFKCPNCIHSFELLRPYSEEPEYCDICHSRAERQIGISVPIFKGEDWPGKEIKAR
jgi:putative FmdB family regulatory protein